MTKDELVRQVNLCDGIEVHKDDWPVAEEAVAEGLIDNLGPSRGPSKEWRRAYPLVTEEN
jgi:hypothetical protein